MLFEASTYSFLHTSCISVFCKIGRLPNSVSTAPLFAMPKAVWYWKLTIHYENLWCLYVINNPLAKSLPLILWIIQIKHLASGFLNSRCGYNWCVTTKVHKLNSMHTFTIIKAVAFLMGTLPWIGSDWRCVNSELSEVNNSALA